MNKGSGWRRSCVIWYGWAHEPVPLLVLRERERERKHAVFRLAFDSSTDRQQWWRCRRDSPSFCGRSESSVFCATACFFLPRLHLPSWRGILKVMGVVFLKRVLECAFKGRKTLSTRLLNPVFSFFPLPWDCSLSLLPDAGNWIYLCNIPRLQQILFSPPLPVLYLYSILSIFF